MRIDAAVAGGPIDHLFQITDFWSAIEWLTAEGKVLALGLVVVAVVAAAAGYLVASFGWRGWIVSRRRAARSRIAARAGARTR